MVKKSQTSPPNDRIRPPYEFRRLKKGRHLHPVDFRKFPEEFRS
jgi:hypothetical protein